MSGLETQDLWFWSSSAWWCSLIRHRKKSQPSVVAKVEQSCALMMHLDVLQSLSFGLKPMDPAQFSSQFQTGALLRLSGCCWHSSSGLLPQPNDTVGQEPTQEPGLKCNQQSISQDHLAMPLHWFCSFQSPESGSEMLGCCFSLGHRFNREIMMRFSLHIGICSSSHAWLGWTTTDGCREVRGDLQP